MKLLIVKTGDGDVYFRDTREGRGQAVALAREMVMHSNVGDHTYADRDNITELEDKRNQLTDHEFSQQLFKVLEDCYAIHTATTQN